MNSMNRRKFVLGSFAKTDKTHGSEAVESPEAVIGKIADFPVGEKKLLTSLKAIVESLPEGLRVQSTENANLFYAIETNSTGELVINRRKIWPANQVFSILTNEPACLDPSREDRL